MGMEDTTPRRGRANERWSPARIYLVVSGLYLVVTSAVGFVADRSFPTTSGDVHAAGSAHVFGIFETNGWHNLAGSLSGILALTFATRNEWSRLGALVKGSIYVAVTLSIWIWGAETFLIASNAADQVAHSTLAVAGLATGLMTRVKLDVDSRRDAASGGTPRGARGTSAVARRRGRQPIRNPRRRQATRRGFDAVELSDITFDGEDVGS